MTTGTVKMVRWDRGFGFITSDDGRDYYFHRSGVAAPLEFERIEAGHKVRFEIEQDPKGPRATKVEGA